MATVHEGQGHDCRDQSHISTSSRSALTLLHLPTELIQHVLGDLADPLTLLSTILTCSSIYEAYLGAQNDLIARVVTNCVDLDAIPEALAAHKSTQWTPMNLVRMRKFSDEWLHIPKIRLSHWRLREAVELNHLHRRIEYFTDDFLSHVLSTKLPPDAIPGHECRPISLRETRRVQRAFYRFEIYCNLFHEQQTNPIDWIEKQPIFFSRFSGFENEQLACVHDYLFRKAFRVLAEFAAHDVEWGASQYRPGAGFDCGLVQHMLARGLRRLYDALTSGTYEGRHQALYENTPGRLEWESLYHGLVHANNFYDGALTPEYYDDIPGAVRHFFPSFHERSPTPIDNDPGPVDAWGWAHVDNVSANRLFGASNQILRDQGYVFWDAARLALWPSFHRAWDGRGLEIAVTESTSPVNMGNRVFAQRRLTRRRAQIFEVGGRGWWSPTDESQVVYPAGVVPPPLVLPGLSYTVKEKLGVDDGALLRCPAASIGVGVGVSTSGTRGRARVLHHPRSWEPELAE